MAIEAKFFTVAKRENSTYKPTENATTLNITLKDITDVLTPIIEVNYSGAFTFNMCYLDFFARWYKIRDVESIARNTYTLALDVDVLATWIDSVLGQSVVAEYCSYDYNVNIDDGRITPTNLISTVVNNGGKPTFLTDVPYEYLSAITSDGNIGGTDVFYNTTSSGALGNFVESLSDISFWDSLQGSAIASNQCNAFDFLNDLYILPFIADFCHDTERKSTQILSTQLSGKCLTNVNVKRYTYTFGSIPRPSSNDFRYSSKYVKYYLNLPYIGVINVPTELIKAAADGSEAQGLSIEYSGDCITGTLTMSVKLRGVSLGIFGTGLKASLGISRQYKPDPTLKIITAAAGAGLAGAKVGGAWGAAASAAGAAIGMGLHEYFRAPDVERVSSAGGALSLAALTNSHNFQLCMAECDPSIDPATLVAIAGRPAEKVTTVQNGYIKTASASVAFAGLAEEVERFNNLLNGGVYVE